MTWCHHRREDEEEDDESEARDLCHKEQQKTTTMAVHARKQRYWGQWLSVTLLLCMCLDTSLAFSPYARSTRCSRRPVTELETADHRSVDKEALKELDACESGTKARQLLQQVLDSEKSLYGSVSIPPGASDRGLSDGDLAIQTKIRNTKYSILELIELNGDKDADRASLAVLSIMVASTASAMVASQHLPGPEIFRFVVVWLFSFAPLTFVGYGIAKPEKLQAFLILMQRNLFPTYRKRMIQHEAAHFLMGHLLGLPIKGYATNAVKSAVEFYPLNDPDLGRDRARSLGFKGRTRPEYSLQDDTLSSNAPFYSKDGRGSDVIAAQSVFRNAKNYTANPFLKLPSQNEPSKAWPFRGFDHATIDQLSVVSVAGVCAEILAFGNAEGGYADLSQLRQIFNSAQPPLDERAMENRIRFALGYTMSQLRQHLGALDALADVMESEGSIADCVLAIETCSNISGRDGIMGDYERRRKEKFSSEGSGSVERILLGGKKNADAQEDRLVAGHGGGYIKNKFQLTGDEPFYAALGASFVFFVWASSGGLSLH